MLRIIERISDELNIPIEAIKAAIHSASTKHRKICIPKKSGGTRIALQPSVELKPILLWVKINLLDLLPVHAIATGFRKNTSILHNANAHKDSLYSVRIDIENFFNSIRSCDIAHTLHQNKNLLPEWAINQKIDFLIQKSCFDQQDRLPIGYLTSPVIANAVMFKIDGGLQDLISDQAKFGQSKLTRYADDFLFSTDKRGACHHFAREMERILEISDAPKLKVNTKKTKFMSRGGGSTLITGLRVNNIGGVVVHPKYRDHIRLLLKLYKKEQLKKSEIPQLIGHLAHIQNVDPGFFTKLSFKYHEEISKIRSQSL